MPADKPASKASENRKSSKPIMEKRRRARINESLSQLKTLILDAMKKDSSRHSKLEKADILEMTVKYLQNVQRQQMGAALNQDPTVLSKYRAGFNECFGEVQRYLTSVEGVGTDTRSRLLGHLANCCQNMSQNYTVHQASSPVAAQAAVTSVQGTSIATTSPTQLQVSQPTMSVQTTNITTKLEANSPMARLFPVMPGNLPSGEVAVLLSPQTLPGGQIPSHFIPVYAHGTPALSPVSSLGSPTSTESSLASPVVSTTTSSYTACSSAVSPMAGSLAPVAYQATTSPVPVTTQVQVKPAVLAQHVVPTESESVWRPW
ncbi:hairy and enhancer of split 1 [Saccoglossus kowalevskii]|uniref:Hairy and enhancer of split 1 n=1 Tax=Saccoglossus kowalevskii TaxID=10224 RepID=B5M226_SACKO|nr:hairy and enhancer of split 1 [Saccoglossus kowalevskii]ACH68438.1 hairy protein [Saccoglossus kowalevskii]